MKENIEQRMMGLFGVVTALLILVAVMALNSVKRAGESSDWVNHTHAVILETDAILVSLNSAESHLRSYILTGDAHDQSAYRQAFGEMVEHMDVAKAMTKADARQQPLIAELETLVQKRVDFARKTVTARNDEGFEAARALIGSDSADETLGEIKRLVDRLKEEEAVQLQQRDRENFLQAQTTRWMVYTAAILNALIIALIFWLIRDDLRARRQAAAALKLANEQLEAKVKERTAELVATNETLTLENLERQWSQAILERQFRHFEQILHSIGDAIYVISRTGRIIRVNPPAANLAGRTVNELIGEQLGGVLKPEAGGATSPFVEALKEGRDLTGVVASIVAKDGKRCAVKARSFPVRDRDRVVGAVVVCTVA